MRVKQVMLQRQLRNGGAGGYREQMVWSWLLDLAEGAKSLVGVTLLLPSLSFYAARLFFGCSCRSSMLLTLSAFFTFSLPCASMLFVSMFYFFLFFFCLDLLSNVQLQHVSFFFSFSASTTPTFFVVTFFGIKRARPKMVCFSLFYLSLFY